MDRQIGPYIWVGMQGYIDRQTGPYFYWEAGIQEPPNRSVFLIGMQGSMDRQIGPYF